METVVSGIRPTGNLHLGNYFGAVKGFLQMQNEYNCFFFIADWHSLTTHPHPDNIRNSVKTILAEYLACGIDPEKATIYLQSDVREIPELYLYLNMNAGIGELMRTTSFKDKARQQLHIDRVNTTEGDVEKEIPEALFCRCHKSFIVNINYVKMFKYNEFLMSDGNTIPVGRNYREKVKQCQITMELL